MQLLLPLHDRLQQAGVFFVPMCGFDCIPTDVGTFLLADHSTQKLNTKIKSVKAILAEFKGGLSVRFPLDV